MLFDTLAAACFRSNSNCEPNAAFTYSTASFLALVAFIWSSCFTLPTDNRCCGKLFYWGLSSHCHGDTRAFARWLTDIDFRKTLFV